MRISPIRSSNSTALPSAAGGACSATAGPTLPFPGDVRADVDNGSAHWDARYTFSLTGRKVHNRIAAAFTFRDGKFATHRDSFDLWRWSRMALGPKGAVLGWTPFVRNTIREQGRRGLDTWMARQAS
jgi:hypothetical protein